MVRDALTLKDWSERFDNVIDSGLFHVFNDEDRRRYVEGLVTVFKPGGRIFLMCFSDEELGTQGPRRVSIKELHDAFAEGWSVESVEPVQDTPVAREQKIHLGKLDAGGVSKTTVQETDAPLPVICTASGP